MDLFWVFFFVFLWLCAGLGGSLYGWRVCCYRYGEEPFLRPFFIVMILLGPGNLAGSISLGKP